MGYFDIILYAKYNTYIKNKINENEELKTISLITT